MERRNKKLIAAFAKVLRERRKMAGVSQEDLAFRAELSTGFISLLETRNSQPTLSVMAALAKELRISVTDLMRDVEAECGSFGSES